MNAQLAIILLTWILLLQSGCTHALYAEKAQEENQKKFDQLKEEIILENQEFKQNLETNLSRMIRNEIIPELREISTYSTKLLKKQKKIKTEVFKKTVIGRVEWIKTVDPEVKFRARIDTGAQTNSIHADEIKEIEKDGEQYVEFTTTDDEGKKHLFLKKVIKRTIVKSTSGNKEKRYVIRLDVEFGGRKIKTNVNLNNRTHLKHNFLVGRNLLLGDYIVDVSQSRLLEK